MNTPHPPVSSPARFGVHSEVGKLRRVLVGSPGLAHERLTPANREAMLFDDVFWVQQARTDHFDFVTKMQDRGVEVLEMGQLLSETLAIPTARDWVLQRRVTPNHVGVGMLDELRGWLWELPPRSWRATWWAAWRCTSCHSSPKACSVPTSAPTASCCRHCPT